MIRQFGLKIRQFATAYVNQRWLPFQIYLIALGLLSLGVNLHVVFLYPVFGNLLAVAFYGILISVIWNLFCKRWKEAGDQLLMFLLALVAAVIITIFTPHRGDYIDDTPSPTNTEKR